MIESFRTQGYLVLPGFLEDREIESWLGELRGNDPAPSQPAPRQRPQQGAEPTTAIPTQNPRGGRPDQQGDEPTTAMPTQRPQDPETTEKLTAQADEQGGRHRGNLSAADLLRREGRGR